MTTPSTPHLEALLQHDINLIRSKLLEMATLDEDALTRAFRAFLGRDRRLAYSVILRDQDIDALEMELDRLCLEFIVRHQPAGGHLRFVYSASKIVNDLERVGDYAESIARQVLLMGDLEFEFPRDRFSELANLAIPMLHNSIRAFVDKNPDLARTTMAVEKRVNQLRDEVNDRLVQLRQEGVLPLESLAPLITVARRFERVSDQATNICEEALYFATGEYVRHQVREGFRVVFLDDTNGCLSRLAEAIGNGLGQKRFSFASAGVEAREVDPQTVRFLAGKGIDASRQPSKTLAEIPQLDQVQVVVALCKEADRLLPKRPSKTVGMDWQVDDPTKTHGTPDQVYAAFERTYATLTNHVRDLVQAILGNDEQSRHDQPTLPV